MTSASSAEGLRHKKVVWAATTNFVCDDQKFLQERDASLWVVSYYTDYPGYWGGWPLNGDLGFRLLRV